MTWGLLIAAAYLLGSVPFSYLMVRAIEGSDIRTLGSGNAGATNVMRAAGKGPALLVLFLDVAKGAVPVAAGLRLGAPLRVLGAVAIAAVAGHVFSVFLELRGGKGVATAIGSLGTLAPAALAVSLLLFVVVVAWKRYVSLGSMVAVTAFPFTLVAMALWSGEQAPVEIVVAAGAIAALVIWRHRDNLHRLLAGSENRLGERSEARSA